MKILLRVCPPHPLAEEVLRFLQLNIKIKVITVLSSRTWATITYYQVSFLNNLRFLQTKDMRHTLDPLHCCSLGIRRNAGKVTLQMLGRCSEAVGVDCCTLWEHAKKNWVESLLRNCMCWGWTRRLGERISVLFSQVCPWSSRWCWETHFSSQYNHFPTHTMGTVLLTLQLRRLGKLNSLTCRMLHDLHHRLWLRINSVIVLVWPQCSWFWASHIPVLRQGKQKSSLL